MIWMYSAEDLQCLRKAARRMKLRLNTKFGRPKEHEMTALEFAKGTNRALGLTLAAESPEALVAELRTAKLALVEWSQKWGADCDLVMWTIVIDTAHHAFVEETLLNVYEHESDLSPLLHSVRMQVNLLDKHGEPVKEYVFERQIQKRKPWWKVW
jgi:hypothetical protein